MQVISKTSFPPETPIFLGVLIVAPPPTKERLVSEHDARALNTIIRGSTFLLMLDILGLVASCDEITAIAC